MLLYSNVRREYIFDFFWKLELPSWDGRHPVLGLGERILAHRTCHVGETTFLARKREEEETWYFTRNIPLGEHICLFGELLLLLTPYSLV